MNKLVEKFQRLRLKDILSAFTMLAAIPQALILKHKRPDLWLICEDENEARDNGFWLYRYIRKEHPEQDCVYAINKKSVDYEKVKDLGEIIPFGGYKHWVYYLAASRNISSQKGGKPNAALCYVLEVSGLLKNTRVFLQHGIILNDLPWLHYKETKMSLFTCSTAAEYKYIHDNFGYPEGSVQCLGLPRFDGLHDAKIKKKQILVMPTWREWISDITTKSHELEENPKNFCSTEYFKSWNSFLKSKQLAKLLEKYDYEIIFYPHRKTQPHIHEFECASRRITIADWKHYDVQQLLKESALLITDYSSILMDFAYMKKPLICYQFDLKKFRKGQYSEGYFDYERDGFGPVCKNEKQLLAALEESMQNKLKNPALYKKREDAFFTLNDSKNCERNYQAIKELKTA